MTDKPTPLSGFPELLPEHRAVERAGDRQPVAQLRAARLRQHRDPRRRADRPALQGRRDRQGDLRAAPAAGRRRGRGLRAGSALRPHRAVRALRPRAQRQARVPVPALPDPAGLARRAAAGRPLPPVHPGRHRRGRPGRAAVPPRRRGGAGDGRGARRAAAAEPLLPGQQPQADPGLLPRPRHPRRHRGDPADRQARQAAGRGGRRACWSPRPAPPRSRRSAASSSRRSGSPTPRSSSGSGRSASRTSCSTWGSPSWRRSSTAARAP